MTTKATISDEAVETIKVYAREQMRVALEAALPHITPHGEIRVKGLEWDSNFTSFGSTNGRNRRKILDRALYPFGAYFLEQDEDDASWWAVDGLIGDEIGGPFEHDWQARAAVDTHYETRILSALQRNPEGEAEPFGFVWEMSGKWFFSPQRPEFSARDAAHYVVTPLYLHPRRRQGTLVEIANLLLTGTISHRGSSNHGSYVEISFDKSKDSSRLAELLVEFPDAALSPKATKGDGE